ncbi:uncharacterized protein AC631_02245 [Debaryomyces fabryi]|uniref:25S rRNA (uridine-N(3))-methyltransferase BMT5-like domain-containing protein n=1 Tax=Debaryomyces fabryi TaxID=58627 RepID=A0A0V1Q0P6_9ASCO|nr:uncharacterized protein AC631_02245 [Debaryomyces fabryi]KSA02032.1 hypothetical protein AC631_02245 [Debaryomyces fabryi]CUM51381.1 unnamed protein product [Debaryomyces fabryi]
MAKKPKGKLVNSKGLKGALARLATKEELLKKKEKSLEIQKDKQALKEKSIKGGKNNKKKPQRQQIQQKGLQPFNIDDKLLLVGEGDFSFAVSIIKENFIAPGNLIATSFDSKDELIQKYPNVEDNLNFLIEEGVQVLHSIDATDLVSSLKLNHSGKNKKKVKSRLFSDNKNLDYIMFNFPHTGKGIKDVDRNIVDHQKLVLNYFKSCREVFKLVNNDMENDFAGYASSAVNENKGKIILTLFEGEPYNSWNIKILGRSENYKVERSGKFSWQMFPDYHHRRTNSVRDTTKPAAERDARIYIFEQFTKKEEDDKKKRAADSDSDD